VTISVRAISCALLCWVASGPTSILHAAPQDQGTSMDRIKQRLEAPPALSLAPSVPVQLRPTFRSMAEPHPFVLTLEQALHKQFDLNALQRQSADWSARCCGIGLGDVFSRIEKALNERRLDRIRQQIARELAELEASRTAERATRRE